MYPVQRQRIPRLGFSRVYLPAEDTARTGFRPGRRDSDLLLTCMEHGILLQGLGPASMEDFRDHSVLCALSEKYGCTVQQLWMRWCLQSDVLLLVCPAGAGELQEYAGGVANT